MPKKRKTWRLSDIVDLESLLGSTALWRNSWRGSVRDILKSKGIESEKLKRQLGLRWMLDDVRGKQRCNAGTRVITGAKILETCAFFLMLLIGVGVLRGLVSNSSSSTDSGHGYNIWVLLGVTLGLQWFFMILSFLGYWLWRRWSRSLSLSQTLLAELIRKWGSGSVKSETWSRLLSGEFKKPLAWRMTRISQAAALGYNLGLVIALMGSLWFFHVGFFWESTLPQYGGETLYKFTNALSLAWEPITLSEAQIAQAQRGFEYGSSTTEPHLTHNNWSWGIFFLFAISVWGFLPRLILWLSACFLERRALARFEFQESQHRGLWREITKVQRGEIQTDSAPADGVVILDIGGIEISDDTLRPFYLQSLRVNPEARYTLGTLDPEADTLALAAAQKAACGVVFLVEGWSLSPKRMLGYHEKVRAAIGDHVMIRYLVLGDKDETQQWTDFVDRLKDHETEVFQYVPPATS
ncbi:MAG: DUF2868 domain-containing protein [Akkermansiaceae bacterium]